jgi:transposase
MYLVVHGTTECRLCRKAREHAKECPVFLLRPAFTAEETGMEILYRRCAGLDVHEKSISVCVRIAKGKHQVEVIEATFPTFTEDLEQLRAWLVKNRVQRVAMESTGVYWRPVWNILEQPPGKLDLLLLNPQHVKALPGHKTDRVDASRIAEWTQYGLLRGSFVPPVEIRELRDLVRRRVHLQQDRNRVSNRIHRLLELFNVKLSSVLGKMTGVTARSILEGLATAKTIQPEALALLARHKRVRHKQDQLKKALRCHPTDHFRFLLQELLEEQERLSNKMTLLEVRIAERMAPYAELVDRLCEIPGVERLTAWTLIAEIGMDMSRFPSSGHLASWCGLCPGNAESAGKRHSGRTNQGNRYVRRALVQAAWAAARITRTRTFFTTFFYRVSSRAGMKKAAIAVAHKILALVYVLIRDGSHYREPGADYFDRIHPERTTHKLVHRLQRLGFDVQLVAKMKPETS